MVRPDMSLRPLDGPLAAKIRDGRGVLENSAPSIRQGRRPRQSPQPIRVECKHPSTGRLPPSQAPEMVQHRRMVPAEIEANERRTEPALAHLEYDPPAGAHNGRTLASIQYLR